MTQPIYSYSDLLTIGATKSHLTHWLREGVIVPVFPQPSGTGHHVKLGFRNKLETVIALFLNAAKIPIAQMKAMLDVLRFIDDASIAVAEGNQKKFSALVKRAPKHLQGPWAEDQLSYLVRRWRLAKTPETRHQMYFGLSYLLNDRQINIVTVAEHETFIPQQHMGPAAIVIDLGMILTALESDHNDRLVGTLTAEEIATVYRR